jgi:hypothetical protein
MARALARDRGQAGQDWLEFVTEVDELGQQRLAEKRRAKRQVQAQPSSAPVEPELPMASPSPELDYTALLLNFGAYPGD